MIKRQISFLFEDPGFCIDVFCTIAELTRILLQHMDDPYAPVPAGTRGTVKYVDDIGQIGVAWDNGRSLSLIPGMDTYRKLTQQIGRASCRERV